MWPIPPYRHAMPPPQSDAIGTSRTALHYTRDVTFQEDQSRIRHNPGVFARLRSFAYNILRRNQTSTFNQDRYAAALGGVNALLKWSFS